ncbi:phage capsid protein [Rhodopseudomonas sp. G2_2311]|uniref:phage capsid protein n=1 Tax=Rhodopseudomonas sp. G2_2311 TaxID=3114287 RepID=UPI0039C713A5
MGPITDAHKLAYTANVQLAVQQKSSKFDMGFTYHPDLSGRISCLLELIGETTAVVDLGRKADTPDIDNGIEPVWITPRQLAWGKLIEKEDAVKALTTYESQFVQAGAKAMVRGKDVILSQSLFAPRKIGQDGTSMAAWNGRTVVAGVGYSSTDDTTACGMNVKKILRARRYMCGDQVDIGDEELFLSLNAQQIEELFRDLTYISADYRDRKVLDQPERVDILNTTILPANDGKAALADYDGSTYTAAMWVKSGMHWGDFDPLTVNVPNRPDKMNRPHPQMEQWVGATRSEDAKVVKILTKK